MLIYSNNNFNVKTLIWHQRTGFHLALSRILLSKQTLYLRLKFYHEFMCLKLNFKYDVFFPNSKGS